MAKFAAETEVTVEKSRLEIERTVKRYGADGFGYITDGPSVRMIFRLNGRHFRFQLTLPALQEDQFQTYKKGYTVYRRAEGVPEKLWEQACRQKWRALALVIKAKLEAIDAGISTLDEEFMANLVLPSGATMAEEYRPQIEEAYRLGSMPKRLELAPPDKERS